MSPTATTTTAHPRVRERRRDVARVVIGRRRAMLAVVLVAAALAVTGIVLVHSSLFAARHITVDGATHTPAATIVAASGLRRHPPLIDVGAANLTAVRDLPWIASATISRHFPDSVTITVTERHALVVATTPRGEVALLDASGRVLERLGTHASAPAGLVPITVAAALPAPGATVAGNDAALVRSAAALPVRLVGALESFGVEKGLGVVIHLRDGATAQLGTASDLPAKYLALSTLLADHALVAGDVADLRIPSSPVLNG